jgi:glycosyltransferase involved in cell wall biosynthesis
MSQFSQSPRQLVPPEPKSARTTIVVPCFNEAGRIDTFRFQEFAAACQGVDFLFINDGSTDGTLGVLERMHAVAPDRFRFVHFSRNAGKAEAVRRGMLTALAERPRYVGFWDADLATPLDEIPRFCRVLDEQPSVELVIGTRLPLLGHAIERRPVRRLLGRLFANVASLALGTGIYDTQCGAKLFRASAACGQLFDEPFLTRWVFDVEIFARLSIGRGQTSGAHLQQVVYEYPLHSWQDVAGSKLKSTDFFKSFVEMARIYWTYLRPAVASPAVTARLAQAGHLPAGASPAPLRTPAPDAAEQPSERRRAA